MSDVATAAEAALADLDIDLDADEIGEDTSDTETLDAEELGLVEEEELEDDDETESEEDEESTEDEDESESDEDDEDDEEDEEEEEQDDGPSVEVAEDTVLKLPDGSTASVKDLVSGGLRQADYTRKTQELARYRSDLQKAHQDLTEWWDQRSQDPAGWAAEIAAMSGDASTTLAQALVASGPNADTAFAGVVKALVENGQLSDPIVQQLGLTNLAEQAKSTQDEDRISRLEQQLEEERQRKADEAVQQQLMQQYEQQWDQIVASEGLKFESPEQAAQARYALMHYARENEIVNLQKAFNAMAYEMSRQTPQTQQTPDPQKAEKAKKAIAKKRTARVVSRSKASGGKPRPSGMDINEAAEAALTAMGL